MIKPLATLRPCVICGRDVLASGYHAHPYCLRKWRDAHEFHYIGSDRAYNVGSSQKNTFPTFLDDESLVPAMAANRGLYSLNLPSSTQ